MTRKLFWEDPYQTELKTKVKSVNGNQITLLDTIFYAFSGAQESDSGSIGSFEVKKADKDGMDIIYTLDEKHSLKEDDDVTIIINWDRRYKLMRLHFAAEIILELVYKSIGYINKIGAHIGEEKARIDFEFPENIASYFPLLEKEANRIVKANCEIISSFRDESNQLRTWEIVGFSKVACGGTHIKRTGEIGLITLKRKNIGNGKERIEIYTENHV